VVYNKNLQVMQNGSGLAGHPSATQSCIFIPKPGSTTNYYIITLDHIDGGSQGGMYYSEIDMTLDGGLGGVLASTVALPLLPATARTPLSSAPPSLHKNPPNSGNAFFD